MIYRTAVQRTVFLAVTVLTIRAYADNRSFEVNGKCLSGSHAAYQAPGISLTDRPLSCNLATFNFFDTPTPRTVINFSQKGSAYFPLIAFDGPVVNHRPGNTATTMPVTFVDFRFFPPGAVLHGVGGCELSFKNESLSEIDCSADMDYGGMEIATKVSFSVAPRQDFPMTLPPPPKTTQELESEVGHEWMKSAPAFCRSGSYSNLTPEQIATCDEVAFRSTSKNWQNVTASNGQVYEVALDTISRNPASNVNPGATLRAAMVMVYESQGEPFNPNNVFTFYFDCHSHYQVFQEGWSPVSYAPPLSVAGRIASIACNKPGPGTAK